MLHVPFYDPYKSYEENLKEGPFGAFADQKIFENIGEPQYDFLGEKVYSSFGIPAGPLINANFCKAAFEKGFDICVYKTVRANAFLCHPFPNILSVKIDGNLTPDMAQEELLADNNYVEPLSITNSFGVPSRDVPTWQVDVRRAISYAQKGQVLVLGFMGTAKENQTEEEFIADYVLAAKQAMETRVKILEMNLSCPNIGNKGLVCYNLDITEKICQAVRKEISSTPLILKVGYYQNYEDVRKLAEVTEKYAQAVSAINTIPANVVDEAGHQALPGEGRLMSGICGAGIKWAGLEIVEKLKKARSEIGGSFKIIGVGGVMNKEDFKEYMDKGADFVMSATGAMWNPYLAQEIKNIV